MGKSWKILRKLEKIKKCGKKLKNPEKVGKYPKIWEKN